MHSFGLLWNRLIGTPYEFLFSWVRSCLRPACASRGTHTRMRLHPASKPHRTSFQSGRSLWRAKPLEVCWRSWTQDIPGRWQLTKLVLLHALNLAQTSYAASKRTEALNSRIQWSAQSLFVQKSESGSVWIANFLPCWLSSLTLSSLLLSQMISD